ncbi:putative disease resistance RPP8-like protein 2 isoform X1 [Carex rostrata]
MMSQTLRSLLCFHQKVMPNCSKQKLLKVVRTDWYMDSINVRMFEGLTQLRYLNLNSSPSDKGGQGDEYEQRYFEKVIGTMKCMQTLRLNLDCLYFPDCAWQINTLRHAWTSSNIPNLPTSTKLSNLQTLGVVSPNESWETDQLPNLPNLCTLYLLNRSCSWMVVAAFLGTLNNLITLSLDGYFPGDIFDMRDFPFYQNLQYLQIELCGENSGETPNEMVIDVIMLPPHLIYLGIFSCRFQQDVISVLENLYCLKHLELQNVQTNRKMKSSAKGFKQLEKLWLYYVTVLEDWEIEEGAMPILREIRISNCQELCVPQGLRHLTNLQELSWVNNGHEGKEDEVRNLCKHVPSLKFSYE